MLHLATAYIIFIFFFFNDTATTDIYTLSLHDALPILPLDQALPRQARCLLQGLQRGQGHLGRVGDTQRAEVPPARRDRKSTRLNSSHITISYAVFCLKKKKT